MHESVIDLIELRRANLDMRAVAAEEGLPLTGENSSAWARFLHAPGASWKISIGRKPMRLDIYQAETARIAGEHSALLANNSAGLVQAEDLVQWNAAVGLRNRIVQDYMNSEIPQIINLVHLRKDQFLVDFMQKDFKES